MRSIQRVFKDLKARRESALITYITGGDPEPHYTADILQALSRGGADIIEVGIPFSDPIADGPTIQGAVNRSLKAGTRPRAILDIVRETKKVLSVPIVILTYYNPVFKMGIVDFFNEAGTAGVDGIIVPDLPFEEADEFKNAAEVNGVDTIFLAAPSTSTERLKNIVKYTSGFLYLVSHYGVTGVKESMKSSTANLISRTIPYTQERIPLAVGFGLSKVQHVESVIREGADGAIVGSVLVDIVARNLDNHSKMLTELESKTRELKKATIKPG